MATFLNVDNAPISPASTTHKTISHLPNHTQAMVDASKSSLPYQKPGVGLNSVMAGFVRDCAHTNSKKLLQANQSSFVEKYDVSLSGHSALLNETSQY